MEATATDAPRVRDDSSPRPPSPLVNLAEDIFESVSPYEGIGFRNHCRRLYTFTSMLMEARGLSFDPDLAYLIAMVHDLGIVSEQDEGHNYLQRSRALFWRVTGEADLPEVRPEVVDECLTLNHRMFSVPNMSDEAECFREAVWMEHTRGLKAYGLDRSEVRQVFDRYPRGNFDAVLWDFTKRTVRREPLTLVNGIFF